MDAHDAPPQVALAPTFTAEVMPALGWATLTDAARACGLSHTTLLRVSRGEVSPGSRVIAALLRGTGRPFADLFTITP